MTEEPRNEEAQVNVEAQPVAQPEADDESQREMDMDKVLMELDGDDPDGDDEEAGDPAPEESAPDGAPSDAGGNGSPALSENYESAINVLRRDGWSADDLQALPEERLIAIAEHRKKMQADVDRKLREKPSEPSVDETAEDSGTQPAEPAPDQPRSVDLDQQIDDLADHLGLDDSGKQLLVEWQTQTMAPVSQIVEETKSAMADLQQRVFMSDLVGARSSVVGKYPIVENATDDQWVSIMDRMTKMVESGTDQTLSEMMEDAVLLEFQGQITDAVKSDTERIRNLRDSGMPNTAARQQATPSFSTTEERQDAVLKLLESDDPDKYRRARAIGKPNL